MAFSLFTVRNGVSPVTSTGGLGPRCHRWTAPHRARFSPLGVCLLFCINSGAYANDEDCNKNGVPDSEEVNPSSEVVFYDPCTSMDQWTAYCGIGGDFASFSYDYYVSPKTSLNLDWSNCVNFSLVDLSGFGHAELSYWIRNIGTDAEDNLNVYYYDGGDWPLLTTHQGDTPEGDWELFSLELPVGAFHDHFLLAFNADCMGIENDWYVDDITIVATPPSVDCNQNGKPDDCDLADGTSQDGNLDGIPDECVPIIYVDTDAVGAKNGSSWADAFVSLTDALTYAETLDTPAIELWVAQGTYEPSAAPGDRTATFAIPYNASLYGGFQGVERDRDERDWVAFPVILSGDLYGDDSETGNGENSYHVVTANYADGCVFDGFTITGGNANDIDFLNRVGAGLYAASSALEIRNCTFLDNNADLYGGGIYVSASVATVTASMFDSNVGGALYLNLSDGFITESTFVSTTMYAALAVYAGDNALTLSDCIFSGNGNGGIYMDGTTGARFERCTFSGNSSTAQGAGVWISGATDALFDQCKFISNSSPFLGGGLYCLSAEITLLRCEFRGNNAGLHGGGCALIPDTIGPEVTECLFSGNAAAGNGGAIYFQYYYYDADLSVYNSSLFANEAVGSGGGVFAEPFDPKMPYLADARLVNSIIWGNVADNGEASLGGDYTYFPVSYSCVQNGWTGAGNISVDPQFEDPLGMDGMVGTEDDNLRLMADSPCIDAGNSISVPLDSFDLDQDGDTSEPLPFDLDGNSRLVDQPRVPDSGAGPPPIVDMGAYEYQVAAIPCEGDANGDESVDPLDSGYVLSRLGCPLGSGDPDCQAADVNGDQVVDPLDVGFILSRFGSCP